MNEFSLIVLDRLICFLATFVPLYVDQGGRERLGDLLGHLLQLRLELAAKTGRNEPAALRETHARILAMIANHFFGAERVHTRLCGRGIGMVWVWLCPTPVLRSGPSRKVTSRARGDPAGGLPRFWFSLPRISVLA